MRIDPNVVVLPVTTNTSSEKQPRAQGASEGAAVVSLSANAIAATQSPEVTTDARLERIRELVERGEYPIDLDMLTARIVEDDLLRGRS